MGQRDDDGPGIPDAEWERFREEIERQDGNAPKEPSARARMVTERLRREDEERRRAERGRFGRGRFGRARTPQPAQPPGWRTGPAWQPAQGRGSGKRRLKAAGAIVLIAGLALVALRPELVIDRITGKTQAREDARNAPVPPVESVRPTAAPEAAQPDRPTLKEPFRGSPALQWADGAAGIEVPAAAAAGGMSKEQVAAALDQAKRFLVAANLDPAVLRGERPEAVLKLLDPQGEQDRRLLEKALARPTAEQDPIWLVTRFPAAEVRLATDVVKTRGRMTFEGGKPGEVKVSLDYTFAYALTKAAPGSEEVTRTIVRRQFALYLRDPARWRETTEGTLQLGDSSHEYGNARCGVHDGYLHPSFPTDGPDEVAPSGAPVDPYDRSRNLERSESGECGEITRF
ncbi:hypothetical protein ACGFX2_19140 [Streptomyces goshikiensis]|uniref:hypothetical protein n=1 Tax=Streptomyces goshikiensis TaxID=1942 RepID=UPI00371F839A